MIIPVRAFPARNPTVYHLSFELLRPVFYKDLITKTKDLPEGRHVIYSLKEGDVEIRNVGVRRPDLAPRPEWRLNLRVDTRETTPRHSDFFTDFLLKLQVRPEARLALSEACELVCNGASPTETLESKKLPIWFDEWGEQTWSFQMAMHQTGGLPTNIFLSGLQCLIRVYEWNDPTINAPERFRQAFVALERNTPLLEVMKTVTPAVRPGKRYFNKFLRTVP